MNRKLALRIFMLISLLVVLVAAPARTSSQTTVYVAPSTITATVGQTFFASINISDVIDLYGWEFKLKWNSTILDLLNVTQGDFLKSGGDTYFTSKNKTEGTEGYILVDCTLIGSIPGVNGSGTLAIVGFKVEGEGESILDLYDTKLVSSLEQPIDHQSIDGNFTSAHDVAVISVIVSPTTVPQGQSININVTVQNQGGYAESFDVTTYYDSIAIETQPVSLDIGASKILTFIWDTTGVDKGDYAISAEASTVLGETDITDNTKAADGMVTVLSLGHDVAIKSVTPSKTIVGQGYFLSVSVTAKNYGSFTETFDVTAYYNETNSIATQTITLTSGNSKTVIFTWNTTGVSKGNCTISATATQLLGETDTTDNTYTDGTVRVNMVGDIAPEFGIVDIVDIVTAAIAFGSAPEDNPETPWDEGENWNPIADTNNDGIVDIVDIVIIAIHFGETDP